jgi:hypothetical protein
MVQEERDSLNSAVWEAGEFLGRAFIAPVRPGNLQIHWPEGEVLINHLRRSPEAGIPDYNAEVQLELSEDK